jgi:hypothetical protein
MELQDSPQHFPDGKKAEIIGGSPFAIHDATASPSEKRLSNRIARGGEVVEPLRRPFAQLPVSYEYRSPILEEVALKATYLRSLLGNIAQSPYFLGLLIPAVILVALMFQSGSTGASNRPNPQLDQQWMQMSRALTIADVARTESVAGEDPERTKLAEASLSAFCRALANKEPPSTDEGITAQVRAWIVCTDNGYLFPLATPTP